MNANNRNEDDGTKSRWFAWPTNLLRDAPERFIAAYLLLFSGVWLLALFSMPGLYLDTYEMFAFGREMQLGYWKHPPLPPWLVEIAYRLTGGWPQSAHFLAIGAVALTLYTVFSLGRQIVSPVTGALAAALTVGNYYFTRPIETFNHNIAQLPAWAATVYFYRQAVITGKLKAWFFLAIVSAALLYAKYAGALLLIVLVAHVLTTADGRAAMRTRGPWIASAVFCVLMAPNIAWLVQNDFITLDYPFRAFPFASNILQRFSWALFFILDQIAFQAPMLVFVGIAMVPRWRGSVPPVVIILNRASHFDYTLIFASATIPTLLTALTILISGNMIRPEVGGSMVALSGLALALFFPQSIVLQTPRFLSVAWLLVLIGVPSLWVGSHYWNAYNHGKIARELWPARTLSRAMEGIWHQHTDAPLVIVAGNTLDAAQVALYINPRPSVFIEADFKKSPWITPQLLTEAGALIIWSGGQTPIQELPDAYKPAFAGYNMVFGPPYVLSLGFSGATKAYNWALLLPKTRP